MRLILFLLILNLSLPAIAADKVLLVIGDSISAGYGISLKRGWVHLLEQRLEDLGYRYSVKNASISGDTTRGARARLQNLLAEQKPVLSIIELGGNDGLRGFSPAEMEGNFAAIIADLQAAGSQIALVPMRLPPNYGPVYNERFEAVYRRLAEKYNLVLTTFILQDIAGNVDLMQSDGIHPRAEAQLMMLDNIWPSLQTLLSKD